MKFLMQALTTKIGGKIMPALTVKGIPDAVGKESLNSLAYGLSSLVGNCLGLNTEEVSVFFPAGFLQQGLGEELICVVDGFFEKPERTTSVRHELAKTILKILYEFSQKNLSMCNKVEVIVKRFNQDIDGFVVWDIKQIMEDV